MRSCLIQVISWENIIIVVIIVCVEQITAIIRIQVRQYRRWVIRTEKVIIPVYI